MTGDGVAIGGGFGVVALGLAATIAGQIGGVPFDLDGNATTLAVLGLVAAFVGLAWAAVRVSRDGIKIRVTHTVDAPTRKLIDTATARIERIGDGDPPAT